MNNLSDKKTAFDPRVRLLLVICLSSMGVLISRPWFLLAVLFITMLLVILLGGSFIVLLKRMRWAAYLFVFFTIIQSIFGSGEPLIAIGSITLVSAYGLEQASLFALRMGIIILSATLLLEEDSSHLIQGLVQCKVPYELAFMTLIAIRFLPLMLEEMQNSVTAIQLRGVDLKHIPLNKRLKVYTYLLLPVLSQTVFRARELSMSLDLRGFGLSKPRTHYVVLQATARDKRFMVLTLIFTAVVLVIYYTGLLAF